MTVLVYGAAGAMGSRLVRALARARIPTIAVGRRVESIGRALAGVEPLPVRLKIAATDGPGLRRAIVDGGVRVVVSCAGAAHDLGTAVLDIALASGAHYVDAATEPSFVAHVHREYAPAGGRGPLAAIGCGARGAVGHWAAEAAMRSLDESAQDVAIAWGHAASTFMRQSAAAVCAAASEGLYRKVATAEFPARRVFAFPPPFALGIGLQVPGPEEVVVRCTHPQANVRTYTSLAPGAALNRGWAAWESAVGATIPALCRVLLSRWGRMHLDLYARRPPAGARDAVCVVAEASANGRSASVSMVADDQYALSVAAIELVVHRLLTDAPSASGAIAPAQLIDCNSALASLARSGIARIFASTSSSSFTSSTSTHSIEPGRPHAP